MPVWICIFRPHPARERWVWAYCIFPREALRVCSFNYDGQCEGLNKRERANSTALTLFHFYTDNSQRGEPSGRFLQLCASLTYNKDFMHHEILHK